jgi:hypothetical protein
MVDCESLVACGCVRHIVEPGSFQCADLNRFELQGIDTYGSRHYLGCFVNPQSISSLTEVMTWVVVIRVTDWISKW